MFCPSLFNYYIYTATLEKINVFSIGKNLKEFITLDREVINWWDIEVRQTEMSLEPWFLVEHLLSKRACAFQNWELSPTHILATHFIQKLFFNCTWWHLLTTFKSWRWYYSCIQEFPYAGHIVLNCFANNRLKQMAWVQQRIVLNLVEDDVNHIDV